MSLHDLLLVACALNVFAAILQGFVILIQNEVEKRVLSAVTVGTCLVYASICWLASGII